VRQHVVPDPVSLDLAHRTVFSYDDVHEALSCLSAYGWSAEDAVRFIEEQSSHPLAPSLVAPLARGAVQLQAQQEE